MHPRTLVLFFSAFFVLLPPFVLWQKERFFASIPDMNVVTSWFWIAEPLLLALFFFASSTAVRQKVLCYACIITASFFLAFALAEAYLPRVIFVKRMECSHDSVYVKSGQATHLFEKDGHFPDSILGYGPDPNPKKLASRILKRGKLHYDVLFSRDEEGRRITPDRGDKADTAVLLFGCSFTFGEGLNDRQTYAWQLGEMLGERFQVFNYGVNGYGSHQMLALIESGRLDALVRRYQQVYASYLTIGDHEFRHLRLRPTDAPGPRYILENGALKYTGKLKDNRDHTKFLSFYNSRVYMHALWAYHRHLAPYSALDLHVAIIAKSMQELTARYHAHALTVIWPDFTRIEPMLRDHGVRTLPLTDVMPDYASAPHGKYRIEDDGHPNARAHTLIAEALSEYILKHPQIAGERQ